MKAHSLFLAVTCAVASLPANLASGGDRPVVSISGFSTVVEFCPPNAACAGIDFLLRRTGPGFEQPLTVFLLYRGTATADVDYRALPGQVTFEAGKDLASAFSIPIDDTLYEGDETIIADIIQGTGYDVDPNRTSATTVIQDNDPPATPVVSLETFPLQNPQALEFCPPNAACAYPSFVVRRSGPTNADLRVYLSYSGTAAAGIDYPSLPDSLIIPAGRDAAFLMLVPTEDTLVEGPETVIARFTPVPGPGYIQDPDHSSATITIIDNEDPLDTVVSIGVDDPMASEISILTVVDPARFRIARTGDVSRDLLVFFSLHGSAIPGQDYQELNSSIRIPAGQSSVTFDVTPIFDQLAEGMETVVVRLEPSPLAGPLPTYEIARSSRDAVAIILDNGSEPTPGLEIVWPEDGDRFTPPASVEIVAVAYHPTRDINRVDFYAGAAKIGESIVIFDRPLSGGLILHRFTWNNPAPGVHYLMARGFAENQVHLLASTPVRITVGPEPTRPVVSIEATQRIAEESSEPLRRLNLVGEFTFSRTGPTNNSQSFFVQYSGIATPVADYPSLPELVTIPPGSVSTVVRIEAINDHLAEGIETVSALLVNCLPCPDPADVLCTTPCIDFDIDPARQSATVFIRDDGITEASLAITRPQDGAAFNASEPIRIEAVAIDLDGYISRVEFWDGEQRIGVSEIVFIRPPDPGTPIQHSFEWRGAASGPHILTARSIRADGTMLKSAPVHMTVGSEPNQPPKIAITLPMTGTQFPPNTPVQINATALDADGFVRRVEFFADDWKIGESNIGFDQPPERGQPQTFTFVWRLPTPGDHVLTARATDNQEGIASSSPVEIRVTMPDSLPIVDVAVRDAFAVEPRTNADLDAAAFGIRRAGPTNADLVVSYSLQGTAQNGVDYEKLSGVAVIPAGRSVVNVIIRPLSDNLTEQDESVILRLEDSPGEQPPRYYVGLQRRAVAIISDNAPAASSAGSQYLSLANGLPYVRFAAESGRTYRIEASSDLRHWENVGVAMASGGALHFVDAEATSVQCRFYRLALEPITDD